MAKQVIYLITSFYNKILIQENKILCSGTFGCVKILDSDASECTNFHKFVGILIWNETNCTSLIDRT